MVIIALVCAAFRRDSVSLMRFLVLNHIQVFSCAISYVFCFSSHFLFSFFLFFFFVFMLILVLLAAVISLSLLFLIYVIPRILLLMHERFLQYRQVLFLLFLKYTYVISGVWYNCHLFIYLENFYIDYLESSLKSLLSRGLVVICFQAEILYTFWSLCKKFLLFFNDDYVNIFFQTNVTAFSAVIS